MNKNESQACSFCCNQPEAPTQSMFQGPGMNTRICGKCVTFAKQLLLGKPRKETHGDCSFCGRTQAQTEQLIFGPGVNICSECVAFASRRHDGDGPANANTLWFPWRRILARVRSFIFGHRIERGTSDRIRYIDA